MKNLKLIALLIIAIFFITDCKKEDITNSKYPEKLLGTWQMQTYEPYCKVLTNSDQTSWDFFTEGDGSITLSGDYQVELKHVITNGEMTFVSNIPFSIAYSGKFNYPVFFIMIMDNMASMEVGISEDEGYLYLGTSSQDFVDLESLIISFDNLELINSNGNSGSIIANGSISPAIINIPANTVSEISLEGVIPTDGDNLILYDDGSALKANHHDDSTFCEWEVRDDFLYVIDTTYHQFQPELDTTIYSYSVISNTLTLIIDEGTECKEEDEKDECLKDLERLLYLDEGSLTDVSYYSRYTYSRSTAVFGNKMDKQYNWHNTHGNRINSKDFYIQMLKEHFKQ